MKVFSKFRVVLFIISLLFIILSGALLLLDLGTFLEYEKVYPNNTSINGVPIGGLGRDEAQARLSEVFLSPIELRYNSARMQFFPEQLGVTIDINKTMDLLDGLINSKNYWDYLWNINKTQTIDSDLIFSYNEEILTKFLQTAISPRYDYPATEPVPIVNTTNFKLGEKGHTLDIQKANALIIECINSPEKRLVHLPIIDESPISLSSENLEIFLKQTVKIEEFDGVVEIFLDDLKYDQDIHFAINQYEDIEQDIAFSAASTIKIPIMLSVFRRLEEPTSETVLFLMNRMISYSENDPADALMKNYIDPNSGPLIISSDLQLLGYENTFLAGFFALGSPVLKIYQTPANTRTDIFLDPDIYNQVTPAEIGDLLKEIYYCSNNNGESSIINTFTNEVTASECQQMVEFLKENKIGSLIEAGLPPEASIAHKHGWTTELDGLLHSMSDVGIVFSPSGDYILTIFIYTGDQLIFDEGNYLFAKLSQIIYNALNINSQEYWWID